jgi:uncharacterized membrane protein YeaQ/YmgE (transglycosylase-associated protein family)
MNLVVSILIGLAIGVMVELLLPGHTPSELVLAVLLGVAGAFRWGTRRLVSAEEPESFVASTAVIILLVYGPFSVEESADSTDTGIS